MKKALATSLIFTFLMVLAYVTKPSKEKCLREAMETYRLTKLDRIASNLPSSINTDLFQETAEKAFSQSLQVNDRFVYREIYQVDNTSKTRIGWGVFGWVKVDLK
jgi:hypothetical protein